MLHDPLKLTSQGFSGTDGAPAKLSTSEAVRDGHVDSTNATTRAGTAPLGIDVDGTSRNPRVLVSANNTLWTEDNAGSDCAQPV